MENIAKIHKGLDVLAYMGEETKTLFPPHYLLAVSNTMLGMLTEAYVYRTSYIYPTTRIGLYLRVSKGRKLRDKMKENEELLPSHFITAAIHLKAEDIVFGRESNHVLAPASWTKNPARLTYAIGKSEWYIAGDYAMAQALIRLIGDYHVGSL